MLYGNVIFIKKTGGDGSKFPVTSTNVCIGRSDECIIRIQNPLVSPKHCQLTIDSGGQAVIRNLSSTNPTFLNDQPLGNGKRVLRQGDILKFGERFARWEYLPSSKYYYKNARSSEPLVPVTHRPRNSEGSVAETFHLTDDSAKKKSPRFTGTGRGSLGRSLRVTPGSGKTIASTKQLLLRRSLQLKKFRLSPQVKLRSSLFESSVSGTPGMNSVNTTPVRKSQKWEVSSVSPPDKHKPSIKNGINRKSTPIKMPMTQISGENLITSELKNTSKAPSLLTIEEVPVSKAHRILTERTTFNDTPESNNISISSKSPFRTSKTPNKLKTNSQKKSLSKSSQEKSLSRAMKDLQNSFICEENSEITKDSVRFLPPDLYNADGLVVRKCVLQNDTVDSDQVSAKNVTSGKLSRMSVGRRKSSVLCASNTSEGMSVDVKAEKTISPKVVKSSRMTPGRAKYSDYVKTTPVSSPKKEGVSRGKKSIPSGVLDTPVGKENVKDTPRKKAVSSSKKLAVTSTQKDPQNRGIKRKLSAIASAERAAKKLKAIAPTKPDKNKKAALLLLGKASGKLKVPQNSNIVMKQKIVKRAIKQFTVNREKSGIKKVNKPKKTQSGNVLDSAVGRSPDLSPKTSVSTKRHSTPIVKTPLKLPKRSSLRKKFISDELITSEICTPLQGSKKRISSCSSISGSDSMEVLHGSVPSKYSAKKSVSFSSTNSSIEYESPDLTDNVKHPVSKQLRSQYGDSSSEFTELSPFALGLTPKRVDDVLKSHRQKGRRSFFMRTPKNKSPVGIIKSASTSKINRKSVTFSDIDSNNSSYLNLTSDAAFDLNEIQTPDVTIDLFVSPLSHKNTPKVRTRSSIFKNCEEDFLLGKEEKDLSPKQSPDCVKPGQKIVGEENRTSKRKSRRMSNVRSTKKNSRTRKSPKNDLTDVRGVRRLMETPGRRKSPRNDLLDVTGVRKLMESPGRRKSPRNDLTDVTGVRRIMESPGRRKSPRNDLTDVTGVRRLMESPGRRKSPRNDLTDVTGVRRLMESPGRRKSPRNDLTDVTGVCRLMESPGRRKNPRNDLTDVAGVRRLMESPGRRRSPRNDLTDVTGVRRLMESPGRRRSPRNDLSDVTGVRKLFEIQKRQKSPKNDLSDLRGVRKLMELAKEHKSPKNDLTDVTGVKELLLRKSPKNDLSNVSGLDTLFKSPPNKIQCLRTSCDPALQDAVDDHNLSGVNEMFLKDEINDVNVDLIGLAEVFMSSKTVKTPKKRTRNANMSSPALSVERPVLRRAAKATSEVVNVSRMTRTRSKANSSSEVPVDQDLKVVRKGRKIDAKDSTEKTVPRKTRTGSVREVKVIEETTKPEKTVIAEEVTTGRRTGASSKSVAGNKAAKRRATPSKSPTPVKRTRKVREKVEVSSTETAAVSNLKKEVLETPVTPESKSRTLRSTRNSTAMNSLKINKTTRSKEVQSIQDIPEASEALKAPAASRTPRAKKASRTQKTAKASRTPRTAKASSTPRAAKSSRSPYQRAKTKKVKEAVVSPAGTRQRKAKAISPARRKASKSSPVKTRRKAK